MSKPLASDSIHLLMDPFEVDQGLEISERSPSSLRREVDSWVRIRGDRQNRGAELRPPMDEHQAQEENDAGACYDEDPFVDHER